MVSHNLNGHQMIIEEWSGFYPALHALTRTTRGFIICLLRAEVVKWQTRTFEGRVGKPMRVQVPPSAPKHPTQFFQYPSNVRLEILEAPIFVAAFRWNADSSAPTMMCRSGYSRWSPKSALSVAEARGGRPPSGSRSQASALRLQFPPSAPIPYLLPF